MKRTLFVVAIIGMVALAGLMLRSVIFNRSFLNERLRVPGPSGGLFVMGLPFKGQKPHPLDNKLRLFVQTKNAQHKIQTTLPVSWNTRIEWMREADPPAFIVRDEHGPAMMWRVVSDNVLCVEGAKFIAPDPYATASQ